MRNLLSIFVIAIATVIGGNVFSQTGPNQSENYQTSNVPYGIRFSVDCGVGFTNSAHQKGDPKIQSVQLDDTSSTYCTNLKNEGHSLIQGSDYPQANDTLRKYIESCATQKGSFHEFDELNAAVQFMSNDNQRWLDFREWLKKVLYLNTDTLYYCEDVNSILTTFQYFRLGLGPDNNGSIAVIDYLLQNHRCPGDSIFLSNGRNSIRNDQLKTWRDSVKDSTKTPLDTSAVSLESLGLGILRGPQFAVSPIGQTHSGKSVISFTASDNPFTNETTLKYDLSEPTLIRIEIYDVLGKQVYSGGEGLQDLGEHTVLIDGSQYPAGMYYARLSTFGGEVQTLKLVHEW